MALARSNLRLLRPVDRPSAILCDLLEIRVRVHGVGMTGKLKHVGIVDRVAKNHVDRTLDELADGICLSWSTRNLDQLAGRNAVLDHDLSRENMIIWDSKLADPVFDHPLVRRRDRP